MIDAVIAYLLANYPALYALLAKLIVIMGTVRLFIKPVQAFITEIVALTATKVDDALWAKILASRPYKILAYVLDYVLSIKLPAKP